MHLDCLEMDNRNRYPERNISFRLAACFHVQFDLVFRYGSFSKHKFQTLVQ